MSTVNITLYEILKNDLKLSDAKAKEFVNAIDSSSSFEKDRYSSKEDILKLELKLEQSKAEIIKWVVGVIIGQTAVIITLLKFL